MTREEYVSYIDTRNFTSIAYAYHLEFGAKKLTPAQFAMKENYLKSLTITRTIKGMTFTEPAIDFEAFYLFLLKHYNVVFSMCALFTKEGNFIKYVH